MQTISNISSNQKTTSKPAGSTSIFNLFTFEGSEELKMKQLGDAQAVADSVDLGELVLKDTDPGTIVPSVYYFHPDHLGSSTVITDGAGYAYQIFLNLPFGETLAEQRRSGSLNNPFKFNGKELDSETGLYYYGARYYDPRISLFISVDPLAEQTMTPYQYTYQNPINLVDPTGMAAEPPGEYEITHDKKGNEVKTKISNLGDDVGIDLNHHLDGDKKGQTEIVNTNNGVTNWIADSRYIRGYEERGNDIIWNTIYREWQDGKGFENSLIFGRDHTMIKDIRKSNLYLGARNAYLKAQAFDKSIDKKYIPIDFGLSGLILSGTNMTMQMMGSGGVSFYDIGDNQRLIMITDQKSKESFYYHLPFIKNVNRDNGCICIQPKQSTTNQTYIWIDKNVEPK